MFNNLNNQNPAKPPVDDIFAETDKTPEGATPPGSEIETRRVGLTSMSEGVEEPSEKKGLGKRFKIILILIIATIWILSGYLVYSKFFKVSPATLSVVSEVKPVSETPTTTEKTVFPATTTITYAAPTTTQEIINLTASSSATTTAPAVTVPIDSDSDGLSDAEELLVKTNINVIDSDFDGLSDYEEVKIYQTNPLSADSDGDGYLDGAEVKSGYNPNGAGKMPGNK
jgi:hypothetical protein